MKVEYRVTKKTVYLIERLETDDAGDQALAVCGEVDDQAHAYEQALLMANADRERLEIGPDDPRITHPDEAG